jgi:GMP synthase-like glutamine amidotransferase
LRIAILETGEPPGDLEQRFSDYPTMFEALLSGGDRSFAAYDVQNDEYPEPGTFDALIVTGSPAGAYDPLPWIAPLEAFLRANDQVPMVGVCFGHQIMAQTFGGKVVKSEKGFAIGLHDYGVVSRESWMDDVDAFAIPASHQDQVVEAPPRSHVVACSAFTPIAALAYDGRPAISFQGHPEFDPTFATALIEQRRGTRFDDAKADAGVDSLKAGNDRQQVGRWIVNFLEAARRS